MCINNIYVDINQRFLYYEDINSTLTCGTIVCNSFVLIVLFLGILCMKFIIETRKEVAMKQVKSDFDYIRSNLLLITLKVIWTIGASVTANVAI